MRDAELSREGPFTTVVSREVSAGREREFEEWINGILNEAATLPGYQGATVLRPARPSERKYVLVVRWADIDAFTRWEVSSARADWYERARPLTVGDAALWAQTGLEGWFTLPGEVLPPTPPPPLKMALVTWLAIFPLVVALGYLLEPALADASIAVRGLATTVVLVPTMTWVVMPRLTRLLWRWLYPRAT